MNLSACRLVGLLIFLSHSVVSASGEFVQHVIVYSSLPSKPAQRLLDSFSRATGIRATIRQTFSSSDEVLARLHVERTNPLADVWIGSTAKDHEVAKRRGLLQTYRSPAEVSSEDYLKNGHGYWTAFYMDSLAFGVDLLLQQKLRVAAPRSWQDLIRPEYRDQIKMPPPDSSYAGRLILGTLISLMGEESAFEYLKRLNPNARFYNMDGSGWFTALSGGKVIITIDFVSRLLQKTDEQLLFILPKEGAAFETGAVSIMRLARRPAGARKLVDWLVGDGQKAVAEAVPFARFAMTTDQDRSSGSSEAPAMIPAGAILDAQSQTGIVRRWRRQVERHQ